MIFKQSFAGGEDEPFGYLGQEHSRCENSTKALRLNVCACLRSSKEAAMVGVDRVTQKRCLKRLWEAWQVDVMDDGLWLLPWKKWGTFGGFGAEET